MGLNIIWSMLNRSRFEPSMVGFTLTSNMKKTKNKFAYSIYQCTVEGFRPRLILVHIGKLKQQSDISIACKYILIEQ